MAAWSRGTSRVGYGLLSTSRSSGMWSDRKAGRWGCRPIVTFLGGVVVVSSARNAPTGIASPTLACIFFRCYILLVVIIFDVVASVRPRSALRQQNYDVKVMKTTKPRFKSWPYHLNTAMRLWLGGWSFCANFVSVRRTICIFFGLLFLPL